MRDKCVSKYRALTRHLAWPILLHIVLLAQLIALVTIDIYTQFLKKVRRCGTIENKFNMISLSHKKVLLLKPSISANITKQYARATVYCIYYYK